MNIIVDTDHTMEPLNSSLMTSIMPANLSNPPYTGIIPEGHNNPLCLSLTQPWTISPYLITSSSSALICLNLKHRISHPRMTTAFIKHLILKPNHSATGINDLLITKTIKRNAPIIVHYITHALHQCNIPLVNYACKMLLINYACKWG